MSRTGDRRGQATVVGATLLFGIAIISLGVYQGVIVPDQNSGIEFNHNQRVQQDMQDLRSSMLQAGATGNEVPVSVEMGTNYPSRALLINPSPASGTVETIDLSPGSPSPSEISITNAEALNGEAADFWDGSSVTFVTKGLRYSPDYNEYTTAPDTIYENSILYNADEGRTAMLTRQQLVDGQTINLVALQGDVSIARSSSASFEPSVDSASVRTVTVTNEVSGTPIRIRVPTRLSLQTWQELVADEPNVNVAPATGNAVLIELAPGNTYDLKMAAVTLGDTPPAVGPAYMTDVLGDETSTPETSTKRLVVEVRNKFNNPVSGVTVSYNPPGSGSSSTVPSANVNAIQGTTDSQGRAIFEYDPDNVDGTASLAQALEFQFDGGGSAPKEVVFDVSVLNSDLSGLSGTFPTFNPSGETLIFRGSDTGNNDQAVTVTFENGASTSKTIDEIRISFFDRGGGNKAPDYARINGTSAKIDIGDDYTDLAPPNEPTWKAGNTHFTNFKFGRNMGNFNNVNSNALFVAEVRFKDGTRTIYFIPADTSS